MSIGVITVLLFGSLILLLALGFPLAFTLGGIGLLFAWLLWGSKALLMASTVPTGIMESFILIAIPLFVFMASVLERSGVAEDLYTMMYRWMGPVRGGLAIGSVLICTIFAAMSGVSATGTVTMGIIALPEMLKRKYNKTIAIGCIMGGGALGQLIPPSTIMILYGMVAEQSVGRLFMAGVLPGLLTSGLFITYILVRCFLNRSLGPALAADERASWSEKLTSIRAIILPAFLVIGVLGSIFGGIATPMEAAAVGAFGSLVCAAIYRKMSWKLVRDASLRTLRITALILWIILGARMFVTAYQGIGAQHLIEEMMTGLPGGASMVLGIMMLIFFVMGCFIDATGIVMITGPVFLPLASLLGFDLIWFGILYVMSMEMAFLTPPFGTNLFYMKGIAPKGVTMGDIYRSIIPFVVLQAIALVIIILFPRIALWLPDIMFGR